MLPGRKTLFAGTIAMLAGAAAVPAPPSGTIGDPQQLEQRLRDSSATAIRLQPGSYGDLKIVDRHWPRPMIIESADPKRPARFSSVRIVRSSNITLRNLDIGREKAPGEPIYTKIAELRASTDIGFERNFIHGSLNDDPSDDMWGIYARGISNLHLDGNRFEELIIGVNLDRDEAVFVQNNEFVKMRVDAIDIAGSSQVTIKHNLMQDFRPKEGDHPDAIQAWTAGQEKGVSNVLIEQNLIIGNENARPQGVFIRDESKLWQSGRGHKSVRIENNVIIMPLWHAIAADNVQDLVISGNTVLNSPAGRAYPGGPIFPWISVKGSGSLQNNVAPRYVLNGKPVGTPRGNSAMGISTSRSRMEAAISKWKKADGQ